MSWDISVQRFLLGEHAHLSDISNDDGFAPLGSCADVQQTISEYFPGTDWSDPTYGRFDSPFGSIMFSMDDVEPNLGFTMHVRASSELTPAIVAMCRAARWQALDYNTGEFLERSDHPEEGCEKWLRYRDSVISGKLA